MDRRAILIESSLWEVERAFPLLGPVFQDCYRSRNHSLALTLMTVVAEECMLCAPLWVIEDTLDEWVCVIMRHLNDHARSVDFLARLLNLNLDVQEGRVTNLGLGYNALRSSHVWAPRSFAGPRRRVLGTMRTRALPQLRLRGGNNGNRAGFAGAVEEVGSGEVLAAVEEVGSDDLGEVLRALDAEDKVDDDAEGYEGDAEGLVGAEGIVDTADSVLRAIA